MSRIALGSNDFLEYNTEYGVLICRECEYAIQKNAVQGHLLRHKIYRGERQNLLSSVAQFALREPDDVLLPEPTAPPVAALPVMDGYRCLHHGCHNLCASVKRMRRHWADVHGGTDNFGAMAREVKIQTFFRGTKIRYFEVSPQFSNETRDLETPAAEEEVFASSSGRTSPAPNSPAEDSSGTDSDDESMKDAPDTTAFTPGYPSPRPPSIAIDLSTLQSFHHLLTTTLSTLPSPDITTSNQPYWQTTVLPLVFSRHWLMSGLLAISSYHTLSLSLTNDEIDAPPHRERALQFFAAFVAGREEASRHVCGAIRTLEEEAERRVGGQIMCVLRCAHWALTEPMLGRGFTSFPFQLHNFVTALRSFSVVERGGEEGDIFKDGHAVEDTARNKDAVALLRRMEQLPSRMFDVFGRADSVKDVTAILTAIATLVKHYTASLSSTSSTAVWHSMVQWLSKVPEHFRGMVARHDVAALVVVAFWVSTLVGWAEKEGCWFLGGLPRKLIDEIEGRVREVLGAGSLIEGLSNP